MRHAENLAGMPEFTGQEKHAISIYPINGIQKSKSDDFRPEPITWCDSQCEFHIAKINQFL